LLFCHYRFDILLLLSRSYDTGTTHPFDVVHLGAFNISKKKFKINAVR